MSTSIAGGAFDLVLFHYMCAIQNLLKKAGCCEKIWMLFTLHVLWQIPKLLLHRLFPNVRYSIWIDGKLQLVVDPYQVLERYTYFLILFIYVLWY